MRLLIVGPPGAGKGTQSAVLAERLGVPAVSTGDIFRSNVTEGTELGTRVAAILDAGDYVPDELTNELVRDRLLQPDAADGFLLDGYPRTPQQVRYLDEMLASQGTALDAVIRLVADEDAVVARLRRRATEQGRTDDSEEAIRHRQEVYRRETEPLVDIFGERGLLVEVDGLGQVDEVSRRVVDGLAGRGLVAA
jgi:adenylate kinase